MVRNEFDVHCIYRKSSNCHRAILGLKCLSKDYWESPVKIWLGVAALLYISGDRGRARLYLLSENLGVGAKPMPRCQGGSRNGGWFKSQVNRKSEVGSIPESHHSDACNHVTHTVLLCIYFIQGQRCE